MQERRYQHLIVGAGFGGLCLAAQLKKRGIDDFIILEKSNRVGGTWRDNIYPGAECDVPSALYSYSFWPNQNWKHKWSDQKQIIEYINAFTDAHELRNHIEYGHEIQRAIYDEAAHGWTVDSDKQSFKTRFITFAVGQLHHPRLPDISGKESFSGQSFHSACWPEDFDGIGKSVAVIGNAASAVQLIPEIARTAKHLTVYQRSPNWCLPKPNREYTRFEHWLGDRVPSLTRIYRFNLWAQGEYGLYNMIRSRWLMNRLGEWACKRQLNKLVDDPELRKKLVPDYPIGAKRILFATDYFSALNQSNVELVTDRIEAIEGDGIRISNPEAGAEGGFRKHDVIVYATGFHTNPFLRHIKVQGVNGSTIEEHWKDGAFAYLGVQTAGFPNMFMLYGPNTNTGHTSIIFKLEAQCQLILELLDRARNVGENATIAISASAEEKFNHEMQVRLAKTAWEKVENSWYKDGKRVTNNWPGTAREYWRRTKNPVLDDFVFSQ